MHGQTREKPSLHINSTVYPLKNPFIQPDGFIRKWIRKLYEALNPSFHTFGTPSSLNYSRVPEARQAFQAVGDWAQNLLASLQPSDEHFLTSFIQITNLALAQSRGGPTYLIYSSRCIEPIHLAGVYLRPAGPSNILPELLFGQEGKNLLNGVLAVK